MSKASATVKPKPEDLLGDLAERPGFLIRRLHQIHVALFHDECESFGITPVQYSVLTALQGEEMDQKRLAQQVGIDRATTTEVLRRLEKGGWIERARCTRDGRRQLARLTTAGQQVIDDMEENVRRAHDRTIEPLTRAERQRFVRYMSKIVSSNNEYGRASLKLP